MLGREQLLLMERGVKALEKLAEDPVIQIEGGPPVCPHCNTLNPQVSVHENDGEGPLALFLLDPKCENCGKTFYAVPLEWAIFEAREEAEQEINQRAEVFSGGTANGRQT